MASRKPEDKDYEVIMPGRGTNHLLDPTKVNEHFELGTTEKKRMMERLSGDRSNDQQVKQNAALGTDASIGTQAAKHAEERIAEHKEWKKTHRHDVSGGGPKSKLRPPRKIFSSFGRGVPYSGGLASFFRSPLAGPAIGKPTHFVPNQGMFTMGISGGAKMLQGPNFFGAFPQFNFQQYNQATAVAPNDAEEED